jgi:hypothetical protein
MLIDVIIVNPTQVDLISLVVLSHGVVVIVVSQAKDGFYYDRFLVDLLFPLVVEIFGCLHQ